MIYAWIRRRFVPVWNSETHQKITTEKVDVVFVDNKCVEALEDGIEAINYHSPYKFKPVNFEEWQGLNIDIQYCTNINQVRVYHPVNHQFVEWVSIQSYLPGVDISRTKVL